MERMRGESMERVREGVGTEKPNRVIREGQTGGGGKGEGKRERREEQTRGVAIGEGMRMRRHRKRKWEERCSLRRHRPRIR